MQVASTTRTSQKLFSCYVTDTDVMWQKRLAQAVAANGDETGKEGNSR